MADNPFLLTQPGGTTPNPYFTPIGSTPSTPTTPGGSTPTVPATPGATNAAGMTSEQESAYEMLKGMFQSYGLPTDGDIMEVLKKAAIAGDSADLVQYQLMQTASWKTRFAGNEARRAAGLNVLSVGEYLQQENQYAAIMRNAGLPVGFFDDPSDFANFIGKSVSPSEVQERVNLATDVVNREDPAVWSELQRRGLSVGMVIAHALDPERAAPLIKRDLNSTLIGAAAARAGATTSVAYANTLASRGIQEREAAQGFGQVAAFAGNASKLGRIYGVDYTQDDAQSEVFDFNADAADRRKRLTSQERSSFSGAANYGVNKSSSAGQF